MSIRFLNPHNVKHGAQAIANCREVSVRNRLSRVRGLFGDGAKYPSRVVGVEPDVQFHVVTEDIAAALSIAPGTTATLSFDVVDADGSADKTVTGVNAVYLGPVEDLGRVKSGPGVATMQFACYVTGGATNPISIT